MDSPGAASLPTISGVWLMSAVRAAASTTMWANVMGSSGLAVAGTTYQWGTGDIGDSSTGLQSSLGLVRAWVYVHVGGWGGGFHLLQEAYCSEPDSQPGPGCQPITLTSPATEERGAPRTLRKDSRRK